MIHGLLAAARRLGPYLAVAIAFGAFVALLVVNAGNGMATDVGAYRAGGARLLETGSPYADWQVAAPYSTISAGAYLYPPPFALVGVLLLTLPELVADVAWTVVQIGAIAAAVLIAAPPERTARLYAVAAALAFLPVLDVVRMANVSGFVALGVAMALRGAPTAGGAAVSALAVLKTAPLALLPAALARNPAATARSVLLCLAACLILTLPFLSSWVEYPAVLLNFAGGDAVSNNNLAPAAFVASRFRDLAWVAPLLRGGVLVLAGGLLLISLTFARRRWPAALAAALAAMVLAPPVIWYHYLVVALPIGIVAFARAGWLGRALLLVALGLNSTLTPFSALGGLLGMFGALLVPVVILAGSEAGEPAAPVASSALPSGATPSRSGAARIS